MGWFQQDSREKMQIQIKIGNKHVVYVAYAAMIVLAIFTIWPIWWLLMSSLKTTQDLSVNPWGLPHQLDFMNYYNAWVNSGLVRNIINSTIVTVISVIVTLICSSMIAYVVSRINFKGRNALYYFFIAGMMIPVHSLVIPLYLNTLSWGMQNNLLVLALVYAAFRIPFSVFILEGFLAGIPKEMEECATIDGCSVWGCFLRIIVPLTRDGMITIGILAMMSAWNELLVSTLLIKRPELKTLTVGLRGFVSDVQNEQTQLFAGLFIACLPSLLAYAFASDKMVKGMTMGAVKG
ncbi:carbohydrate ABC transporter permease [Hungatella hathewayi]|uniref:carbohydrate ABC transporter permease n=1 Tax=Hungatella hathewayi TaxID=154046 RepID=UPI00210AA7EF|nr:carbohydrate ABC transporter permease [Hungatella hathewayi]MCQ5386740.1 carbohydrate ABC transporter permease [Hungatella hathewayi]